MIGSNFVLLKATKRGKEKHFLQKEKMAKISESSLL